MEQPRLKRQLRATSGRVAKLLLACCCLLLPWTSDVLLKGRLFAAPDAGRCFRRLLHHPRTTLRAAEPPTGSGSAAEDDFGDSVFGDLFDGTEPEENTRDFRDSMPRRTSLDQKAGQVPEEWGLEPDFEERAEGSSGEESYEGEEEDDEDSQQPDPEVSDEEVDEFMAELAGRPAVAKEDNTVPIDPFGSDASLQLDTFQEMRLNPARGLLYQRGMPDQQMMLTLKDRLTMLRDFAQEGNWKRARYVMRGIWRKKRLRLPLGRVLWNTMIKAHANAGRPKAAESWVVDMLDRVFQPDIVSYNTLLECYGKRGEFLSAEKWLRRMRARGVPPNMFSYGAVASAYAKIGDLEGTQRVVSEIRNSGCEVDPSNTMPHNAILKLCAQAGKDVVAGRWFEKMLDDGVTPDGVSFLQMIKASAQAGDLEGAAEWLKRMNEAGIEARRQHFHAVMAGHAKISDLEGVEAWLRVMMDEGHRPDTCSYNILLSAASQGGNTEAAEGIMSRMKAAKIGADLITYSTLIGAFAEAANVTGARYWLFQGERDGLKPDVKCYNQAIKACSRAGNATMAEQLARRLLRYQLSPDSYTYNTLLSGFAKDGNWKSAEFWVDHLQRLARRKPEGFPLKQIGIAYSEVLLAHVRAGNLQAAKAWHLQMLGEGVEPDARCYTALARAHLEIGELEEAQLWTNRMNSWSNYRTPADLLESVYGEDVADSRMETASAP